MKLLLENKPLKKLRWKLEAGGKVIEKTLKGIREISKWKDKHEN